MGAMQFLGTALALWLVCSLIIGGLLAVLRWLPRSRVEAWDKLLWLGGLAIVILGMGLLGLGAATGVGQIIIGATSAIVFLLVVVMIGGTLLSGNRHPEA